MLAGILRSHKYLVGVREAEHVGEFVQFGHLTEHYKSSTMAELQTV